MSGHYASKQLLRTAVEKSAVTMSEQQQAIETLLEYAGQLEQLLQLKMIECNFLKLQLKLANVPVR